MKEMQSIIPMLADMQPAPRRSFKKFRTINGALGWVKKHPDNRPKLRMSDYSRFTRNPRDKWFIVNFTYRVRVIEE